MRKIISGVVGVLWGGVIVANFLIRGGAQGEGGYRAGQYIALVMGLLLFFGGLYYLVVGVLEPAKSPKKRKKKPKKRRRVEEEDENDE